MEELKLTMLTESRPGEVEEPKSLRLERASLRNNPPIVRFAPPREPRVLSYR